MTVTLTLLGVLVVAGLLLGARPELARAARRGVGRLRRFHADQIELHERLMLLDRPWEQDLLHWCHDGHEARLHGHVAPPRGRRRSVTRRGWCPCHRAGAVL